MFPEFAARAEREGNLNIFQKSEPSTKTESKIMEVTPTAASEINVATNGVSVGGETKGACDTKQ